MHLSGSVGVSLALVVPSVLGVLYLLLWQSYVLRCATQQESFWGLTLLTVLKPFLTNIKKYSVIEESQRKLTWDIYHVSSAIPPRNLIVRGCFVLEMVSFRLEVVTSSIQLAMVSGQVKPFMFIVISSIRTKIMTMTTTVTMTMSAIMTPTMTMTMTLIICIV